MSPRKVEVALEPPFGPLPQMSARTTSTTGSMPKPPSKGALKPERQAGAFGLRFSPVARLRLTPFPSLAPAFRWQPLQLRPVPLREGAFRNKSLPVVTKSSVKLRDAMSISSWRPSESWNASSASSSCSVGSRKSTPGHPLRSLREVLTHSSYGETTKRAVWEIRHPTNRWPP